MTAFIEGKANSSKSSQTDDWVAKKGIPNYIDYRKSHRYNPINKTHRHHWYYKNESIH